VLCESEPVHGQWFVLMQIFRLVEYQGRAASASNETLRFGDGLPYQWLFCFPLSCFPLTCFALIEKEASEATIAREGLSFELGVQS